MSVAVLVQARIKPERLAAVLAVVTQRVESANQVSRGRLRERIFQRLGAEGDLLSFSQWASTEAFGVSSTTLNPTFLADVALEPPQVHRLVRLLTFERPLQRAAVTACALIGPTRGDSRAVRERVVHDRREIRSARGLLSHEIYVTPGPPVVYLSIHSWRHLADLHQFREEGGRLNEQSLAEVGATLERFTGALVAEYPLLSGRG